MKQSAVKRALALPGELRLGELRLGELRLGELLLVVSLSACTTPGEREYNLALAEGTKAAIKSAAEYHDLFTLECDECSGLKITVGNQSSRLPLNGYQLSNKGAEALTSFFSFATAVAVPLTTGKGLSYILREVNGITQSIKPETPNSYHNLTNINNTRTSTFADDNSVRNIDNSVRNIDNSVRNTDNSSRTTLLP